MSEQSGSEQSGVVRRAVPADREALLQMQAQSFRTLGRHHYGPEVIEAFLTHVGTLDPYLIEDRTYLVIEHEGVIMACGGWSVRRPVYAAHAANDAELAPQAPVVRAVYTNALMVRQGLGRRIMAMIEAEILQAGFDRVSLTATLSGLPLYRAIGYQGDAPVIVNLPGGHPLIGIAMEKRFDGADARRAA
jgi:GNAT superfamily N-acetyltransferase